MLKRVKVTTVRVECVRRRVCVIFLSFPRSFPPVLPSLLSTFVSSFVPSFIRSFLHLFPYLCIYIDTCIYPQLNISAFLCLRSSQAKTPVRNSSTSIERVQQEEFQSEISCLLTHSKNAVGKAYQHSRNTYS